MPEFNSIFNPGGGISPWDNKGDIGGYTVTTSSGTPYYTPSARTSSAVSSQIEEVLKELRYLRADLTRENGELQTAVIALEAKIAAMEEMIEADATLKDRKAAKRKIEALEEQLRTFREYYEETQETFYKK